VRTISATEWIESYRLKLSPEYWADLFCRAKSEWSLPPRALKDVYEHYYASAFAFWLQVAKGTTTSFLLLDAEGTGAPDCEFTHGSGRFWIEIFAVYFPRKKLECEGRVHLLDKLIRERLQNVPFAVTIRYDSYLDVPSSNVLRNIGRRIGDELASQLSSGGAAQLAEPVHLTADKTEMPLTVFGSTDLSSPRLARDAFRAQLERQLPQAMAKLRCRAIEHGAVLVITDRTNAAQELGRAFSDLDPAVYEECGGVFWLNASRRPFTLEALYESGTLLEQTEQ
jgi:hypothetical protein